MDPRLIIASAVLLYGMLCIVGFLVVAITPYGLKPTRFERLLMSPLIPLFFIGLRIRRAWCWFFVDRP
ncbi:MAG: hypothetical protein EOO77_35580 [Oxalobacteraceae bacterium]|nr:MAG: hypothetical protein EOO77_35580 [Oxalobacteraceae bacterium]